MIGAARLEGWRPAEPFMTMAEIDAAVAEFGAKLDKGGAPFRWLALTRPFALAEFRARIMHAHPPLQRTLAASHPADIEP